ncbi:CPBP family intramembrane glutamic endopeptidase [Lentibacillus sp. CBA3610]|uniref:CPBP family intramembrane glutamic endopeptidase n=1 Tax=Lentibacillus sp. CBA3610 TaxID=2518176 RepID=UPI001596314F|nr:type II CAAX endopeptidase family protein [Lentibacillus sp. CBA3610]QKY71231.1 CPBP family intramembrane metalloprotease [Lentibacillus sp. CBA3610]
MPRRYWYVILTYIIMQFSGLLFAPVIYFLTPLGLTEASIYWSIFSFIAALVIVLLLMRPDMKMEPHRNAAGTGEVVLWSIAGLFMTYAANYLATVIETLMGIAPGSENTQMIMDITRTVPAFIVITTVIAPILEELVFRKIIFGELYKRLNFFWAAALSSFIFGIIHDGLVHILIYAAIAFVFAFLYVKTKRIIVPIIVHMAMNSISVIVQLSLDPKDLENMMRQLEEMQMIL